MASVESRAKKLLAFAIEVAKGAENWIVVQNAVYGIGGKMADLFPDEKDRIALSRTDEFRQIGELIVSLRKEKGDPAPVADLARSANGSVSIRMPKTIHAALLAEARAEGVSLNQLCLAKLCVQLQALVC